MSVLLYSESNTFLDPRPKKARVSMQLNGNEGKTCNLDEFQWILEKLSVHKYDKTKVQNNLSVCGYSRLSV